MSISVTLEAMGFEYDEIPLPNRLALTSTGRVPCPNSPWRVRLTCSPPYAVHYLRLTQP